MLYREPQLGRERRAQWSQMRASGQRIVCVGDLNGSFEALQVVLRGTGLTDPRDRWTGGSDHLVQMGDIFNRGSGGRASLELLLRLRHEARAMDGAVTVILGNHEVMTALGNEAYCTVGEYLSFATAAERNAWPDRVRRAFRRIYDDYPPSGPVPPFAPRLDAWMVENAPGRAAMRRALGPNGRLGRYLRAMPIAALIDDAVFVHGGLTPVWARLGVEGLNRAACEAWLKAPAFWGDLSSRSILRASSSPIATRELAMGEGPEVEATLAKSLELLGARRMIVGHTITRRAPGGRSGHVLARFDGRLVLVDVGMREDPLSPRTVLIMEGERGYEWTPGGTTLLWTDRVAAAGDLRTRHGVA